MIPQFFGFVNFRHRGRSGVSPSPFDQPSRAGTHGGRLLHRIFGSKFGLFFVGVHRYRHRFRADGNALFFGGWHGPVLTAIRLDGRVCFMMMFILIRASLPRPRYDGNVASAGKFAAADAHQLCCSNGGCHSVAGAIKEHKDRP